MPQNVLLFAKQSIKRRQNCKYKTLRIQKLQLFTKFPTEGLDFAVAAATRVRVSAVDLCFASHDLTYACGFHFDSGGP